MSIQTTDVELLTRASYDNGVIVTAGTAFPGTGNSVRGFWIMPLTSGSVVATTWGDQSLSHSLPVALFPLKIKKLDATTAVDVLIMW